MVVVISSLTRTISDLRYIEDYLTSFGLVKTSDLMQAYNYLIWYMF